MALEPGVRLGPYEILAPLGSGGMGEVYRARDTTLRRDVALKLLPDALAKDPDRVARFRREAHVLASLNHPGIGGIYGLEEEPGGRLALVLELVPGQTLADRLRLGAIPVDEAVVIAQQIAAALEEAHERGVVHRDLKPANVKVSDSGRVKVLDFGLARALFGDMTSGTPDHSVPPTLSSPTVEGVILGTPAYMAPEQARGKAVDRRADIWAFGVVVLEMLTGRRAFEGETVTDTITAVLTREPDWSTLPAATPHAVRRVLRLCLVRDPQQRLHDIGDARLELEAGDAPAAHLTPAKSRMGARAAWAIALVASGVAGWALWSRAGIASSSPRPMFVDFVYSRGVESLASLNGGFAISPDGTSMAMIGVRNGERRLFLRELARAEAVEIPDSQGVSNVAFSPDGRSLAFTLGAGQTLVRLSLADRERTQVRAGVDIGSSIAWGESGLVYARNGGLNVVSTDGGQARVLTTLDAARHEVLHADPFVLPRGKIVLFSSLTTQPGAERIEAVPITGGPRTVVVERAVTPIWSPTGHLLFARDGAILATPFDVARATVSGAAVPVIPEGVIGTQRSGTPSLRLSPAGTLAFMPSDAEISRVVSVGRDGAALELNLTLARHANPRLSPDGRRLLVGTADAFLEALDLTRGTRVRLTAAAPGTNFPSWGADGQRVLFRRYNSPFWVAADGSGKEGLVPRTLTNDYPSAPGPDPDSLIVVRVLPETSGDVYLISISGAFEPRPLVATPAYEGGAQLSPDGRYLLYQSNESGQFEVYVRAYPALDRSWQASEGGGFQPRWSPGGREIFYRNGRSVMAVAFEPSAAEPVLRRPVPVFADDYDFGQGTTITNYDVTADGRFIMLRREPDAAKVRAVLNWTGELTRILAGGGAR